MLLLISLLVLTPYAPFKIDPKYVACLTADTTGLVLGGPGTEQAGEDW